MHKFSELCHKLLLITIIVEQKESELELYSLLSAFKTKQEEPGILNDPMHHYSLTGVLIS